MSCKPWTATVMLRVEASSKEDIKAAVSYYTNGEWEVWSGPKQGDHTGMWEAMLIHVMPKKNQ